jgi:phenylglyoxylate dehydrogenase epsilon subunit
MADALRHLEALRTARSAIVLGTGLVGLHAAENFAERGLAVHVVRARAGRKPRILPAYFDPTCAGLIQGVFEERGVRFHLEAHAVRVEHRSGRYVVALADGSELQSDLVLVCTGIRPRVGFLAGSAVETRDGVLVDGNMRTNAPGAWAAGDVAEAPAFFGGEPSVHAILPEAVAQGKAAGADMAGARLDSEYPGGLARNAFGFFGHRAFSVGLAATGDGARYTVEETYLPAEGVYRRMIFDGRVLVGVAAVDSDLDPGILCELVRRRVDLGDDLAEFIRNPAHLSRRLMWKVWR